MQKPKWGLGTPELKSMLTFLVEGYEGLGDGLTDGVDLGNMTTTVDTHADVNTGEFLL